MADGDSTPLEAATIKTLHHRRGHHQALVTKMGTKIEEMHDKPILQWDVLDLQSHSYTINQQVVPFGLVQEELMMDSGRTASQLEAERNAQENFEMLVSKWTSVANRMLTTAKLHEQLSSLYRDITMTMGQEISAHTTRKVGRHRTTFDSIRRDGGTHIRSESLLTNLHDNAEAALDRLEEKFSRAEPLHSEPGRPPTDDRSHERRRESSTTHRLPRIELPVFTGSYLEWQSFWTIFERNVHNNSDLQEAEKVAYLQKAIQDKARPHQTDTPSYIAGCYDAYVGSLKERYDRKRRIHSYHTKAFFQCRPCRDASAGELARLYNTLSDSVTKLQHTEQFTASKITTAYAESLLPPELWDQWQLVESDPQVVPDIGTLLKFLEKRSNLAQLKAEELGKPKREPQQERPQQARQQERPQQARKSPRDHQRYEDRPTRRQAYATSSTRLCDLCKEDQHPLFFCLVYKGMSIKERTEHVKAKRLCFNCLSHSHPTKECGSSYKCKKCGKTHHTTLHREEASRTVVMAQPDDGVVAVAGVVTGQVHTPGVFIPTLQLVAHSPGKKSVQVRAMLDTGSTLSLITASVVRRLGLKTHKAAISIVGVHGSLAGSSKAIARFVLKSEQVIGGQLDMTAYVVENVAGELPQTKATQSWDFLQAVPLADPGFNIPGKVDVLLGNDILDDIVQTGTLRGEMEFPRATKTIFGWVVEGRMSERELPADDRTTTGFCSHITRLTAAEDSASSQQHTDELLKSFWELESLPKHDTLHTPEEAATMDHFLKTHLVTSSGRYQVTLPRATCPEELGSSRGRALHRFQRNEASLLRKGRWKQFQEVIQEYITMEHAERIPATSLNRPTGSCYYMPMHAVIKASSTTTKLRVVFDASAASSTGISFNETLLTGPTLQPKLTTTLTRFRLHKVAVNADISKMYRAILLSDSDRDYHRFLWRPTVDEPISDYRMNRVTFGVAASPFVATRVLQQISNNAKDQYPEAARQINTCFYVDDYLSGASNYEEALKMCTQVIEILKSSGMTLRKWRSSSQGFLSALPPELLEQEDPEAYGPDSYMKTLGIHWDATADHFYVSTSQLSLPITLTKRLLSSDIHRTFDVLGWLTPVTLQMKVLLQELWEERLAWDECVTPQTQATWSEWRKELPDLTAIPIPRHFFRKDCSPCNLQLHGFSDASMKAYAAVIYIWAEYNIHPPTVMLVTSKSKVAPLKPITIPKLELCGAHLLAHLMRTVMTEVDVDMDHVTCWTDSTIVLNWLDGSARRYRTYVGNRIADTLEQIPAGHWKHVPTSTNPADCASRGIQPRELVDHPLWWTGPKWLASSPIDTPPQPIATVETLERKTVSLALIEAAPWLTDRCSTYQKLHRVTAWILRFTRNSRPPEAEHIRIKELGTQEIARAETVLHRLSQQATFGHGMNKGKDHPDLRSLNPFIDKEGVLRVGGRLGNSALELSQLHPIILHSKDRVCRLMIQQCHVDTGHAGPTLMLTRLGRQYHLIRAMRQMKATCRQCVTCKRQTAPTEHQLMGQLPAHRVTPGPVFGTVGIDLAGPLLTKYAHVRRPVIMKTYVCIYVCMATRAIHLEPISDQTTEAFLASFDRFIARRGRPADVFSDNGGNFVGAARQLEELFIRTPEAVGKVTDHCSTRLITWHFSPERAPHFGGMWEAGVKSFKFHLRRIMGSTKLTFEEMTTVLCKIESMLNSRPLMRQDCHSEEGLDVLTPGHFIIGRPLEALPTRSPPNTTSLIRRWNLCQQLTTHFWDRWSTEYLRHLQQRGKWTQPQRNIQVNDVVLMREDGVFTHEWPMAKVIEVYPGQDGLVRVVLLRAKGKTFKRPIAKITLLLPAGQQPEDTEKGQRPFLGGGMSESQEATDQAGC